MSERDIFLAARTYTDPAAQTAYLTKACGGDAALRARIERLLRADSAPDSLLDVPAIARLDSGETHMLAATPPLQPGSTGDPDDEPLGFLSPSERADSLGRIGHYEVLEILGRGGFGIVLRAFDEVLQRVVAVKVLAPPLAVTSPARKRFLREARSSAAVRHENVVQVYAVAEKPLPYLVMEFIPGETLQERIDRTGPLDTSEVLRIGRQIAEGLAAAHAMNLIHRDIKPANVLIDSGPHAQVKLTDFGLARAADDASVSQSGIVAGTPMYMSPEQARGEHLDHRTDLFSLGSVLYVMTSGRPPFRAANSLAVLKRVNEDIPRPIQEIIPETPSWLCDIIARLHAKNPADRFQSAQEVAELLACCQTSPPSEVRSTKSDVRKRFLSFGRIAAAVLLLLAGGLGLTEATGVTQVRGTMVRLFTPDGILVVEVDDPDVSISVDGEDVVITGAGMKELRVRPGPHKVLASKNGKVVSQQLVTVIKDGKETVRVRRETPPAVDKPAVPKVVTDPDRTAAEWALSSGGYVRLDIFVDGKEVHFTTWTGKEFVNAASELPKDRFELRWLNVNRNRSMTDEGLVALKGLKHLTFLQLTNNGKTTDAMLPYIKDCKKLETLLLYSTGVTDAGLPHLTGFTELKLLSLKQTRVTEEGANKLAAALPRCRIEWKGGVIEPKE